MHRVVADRVSDLGKRLEHNLELLRRLGAFGTLGVPLLAGASRKRFIGDVTVRGTGDRLGGSIAAALVAAQNGACIVRVHDVKETVADLDIMNAVTAAGANAHAV